MVDCWGGGGIVGGFLFFCFVCLCFFFGFVLFCLFVYLFGGFLGGGWGGWLVVCVGFLFVFLALVVVVFLFVFVFFLFLVLFVFCFVLFWVLSLFFWGGGFAGVFFLGGGGIIKCYYCMPMYYVVWSLFGPGLKAKKHLLLIQYPLKIKCCQIVFLYMHVCMLHVCMQACRSMCVILKAVNDCNSVREATLLFFNMTCVGCFPLTIFLSP